MQDTQASIKRTSTPSPRVALFLWRWFWRVTLVVSLAYAWYCFYVPSNNISWAINVTSAQQKSAQSGKPLILYFTGKWCVPCRIMKRNVWADEEVTTKVNAKFIPVAIDVDNPDTAAVLARYNVTGPPVTIVTDSRGDVLQWQAGGMGKEDFLDFLEQLKPQAESAL